MAKIHVGIETVDGNPEKIWVSRNGEEIDKKNDEWIQKVFGEKQIQKTMKELNCNRDRAIAFECDNTIENQWYSEDGEVIEPETHVYEFVWGYEPFLMEINTNDDIKIKQLLDEYRRSDKDYNADRWEDFLREKGFVVDRILLPEPEFEMDF